jgi:hypothetical protein
MICSCHGRAGSKDDKGGGLSFSVDTAALKHLDSTTAAEHRTDSILLRNANSTPGINAGAGNFVVNIPRGWRRTDTLLGNIRAVILDTASTISGFRTNLSIVSDSMRRSSVDDYQNGTINSLVQYVPQFALIGKGERTFGNRPARWLHYSQDRDGTALDNICYLIPVNGIMYILTCSALKGRLVRYRPAFETAVTSFSVH